MRKHPDRAQGQQRPGARARLAPPPGGDRPVEEQEEPGQGERQDEHREGAVGPAAPEAERHVAAQEHRHGVYVGGVGAEDEGGRGQRRAAHAAETRLGEGRPDEGVGERVHRAH